MYIYLYDRASESGLALKDAIHALEIRHQNSQFRGDATKTIINWGCSELPRNVRLGRVVNKDTAVYTAVNKLAALRAMAAAGNVPHVPFTADVTIVRQWLDEPNTKVYARLRLTGHDGAGVVVLTDPNQPIPEARLYTKGVPIQQEYRVTVVRAATTNDPVVIAAQRKVKADTAEEIVSPDVRTSGNGWGFKLIDHTQYLPNTAAAAAMRALAALELDFAGIDVVYLPGGQAAVLEVNTAPQLTPTVLRRLADHLTRRYA